MHIKSLEYFRAVAIIFIVAGHCIGISGWKLDGFEDRVLANLIGGGSALFVFISGFLFHHVFYPKFNYRKFIWKKFQNVYIPYLILATLPIVYAVTTKSILPEYFFGSETGVYNRLVEPAILYYFYGGVLVYWYIPFIMTMFLMSPVFCVFIKTNKILQITITAALFVVAIFVHRPIHNISIVQSVVFFTPMYLLGIMSSINKEFIYSQFKNKEIILFIGIVLLAILQSILYKSCGNLQSNALSYRGIDINYIQKIVMSIFFMVYLHRFENNEFKVLKSLASTSFAIYFIHGWLIEIFYKLGTGKLSYFGFHIFPLVTVAIIFTSHKIATWTKKVIPEKSRYITGY